MIWRGRCWRAASTGPVTIVDPDTGRARIIVNIAKAARLTVQEGPHGPRFVRYRTVLNRPPSRESLGAGIHHSQREESGMTGHHELKANDLVIGDQGWGLKCAEELERARGHVTDLVAALELKSQLAKPPKRKPRPQEPEGDDRHSRARWPPCEEAQPGRLRRDRQGGGAV